LLFPDPWSGHGLGAQQGLTREAKGGEMIRACRQTNKAVVLLFAAMIMLLMASAFTRSQAQTNPEAPAETVLVVKGQVKEISYAAKTLVVKPKKGDSVPIIVTSQTTFVGFSALEQISPKQRVQVWYSSHGESNLAVKIEKMPELGC
jgi:hypothetical protein